MKQVIILWLLVLGVLVVFVVWGDILIAGLNRTHLRTSLESEPTIAVVNSKEMQPFGVGAEDEVRAMDILQPTYAPMVSVNGQLIQTTTNPFNVRPSVVKNSSPLNWLSEILFKNYSMKGWLR